MAIKRGSTPRTAKSLALPQIASSPISPPGKSLGETVKLSIVTPIFPQMRAQSSRFDVRFCSGKTERMVCIRFCVSRPPLPWPRVTFSRGMHLLYYIYNRPNMILHLKPYMGPQVSWGCMQQQKEGISRGLCVQPTHPHNNSLQAV